VAISNKRIIGIANDQVAFREWADAEGKTHTALAGWRVHCPLLVARPAQRLQAHPALWSTLAGEKKAGLAAPPPEPAIIESVAHFYSGWLALSQCAVRIAAGSFWALPRCCHSAGKRLEDHL